MDVIAFYCLTGCGWDLQATNLDSHHVVRTRILAFVRLTRSLEAAKAAYRAGRPEAARRLPRLTRSGRSELAVDVTRACSWSRPSRLAARPTGRRVLGAWGGSLAVLGF